MQHLAMRQKLVTFPPGKSLLDLSNGQHVVQMSPHPPPPGVSIRRTLPAETRRLHLPGSSTSISLPASLIPARPAAPSPPPCRPYGRNFLRSASSDTCTSASSLISRTSPSPPRYCPVPPEP